MDTDDVLESVKKTLGGILIIVFLAILFIMTLPAIVLFGLVGEASLGMAVLAYLLTGALGVLFLMLGSRAIAGTMIVVALLMTPAYAYEMHLRDNRNDSSGFVTSLYETSINFADTDGELEIVDPVEPGEPEDD